MHPAKCLLTSFWIACLILPEYSKAEQNDLNKDPSAERLVDRLTHIEDKISSLENIVKRLDSQVMALTASVEETTKEQNVRACDRIISDCGQTDASGVFNLRTCSEPDFNVFCNQSFEGGGWLVVYNRSNGNDGLFNHTWKSYEEGFGQPNGEHFIGLRRLHSLTHGSYSEAALILTRNGEESTVTYDDFEVDGEEKQYEIKRIGSPNGKMRLFFSNQAYKFQTFDRNQLHALARDRMLLDGCAFWFVDSPNSHNSEEFSQFCQDLRHLKIMIRKRPLI
ncbi:hypothetical protein ZHAS_00007144 [Anopheles sinensis]|uniref:Fibrinogen C-terminal domain-containing protein n=1 Tax=Anopheles sinensis TaxID=74873 RepID=A0A084VP86_ANOSI|nr:hypothetical protein ZHAS_00007144 [Anopheles sinensis]